jgi:diguanylate cyclase (GGDEF)-like protein
MDSVRRLLAALTRHEANTYAGADADAARRFVAATWGLTTLLLPVFLALAPPTDPIGSAGWIVAGALVVVGAVGTWAIARREPSFPVLLVVAYGGVVQLAALQWLAGGDAVFGVLYLLWMSPGAVHPPRRAFPHLAFLIAAILLPAAYGSSGQQLSELVGAALLVVVAAPLLIAYLTHVRSERVVLRAAAQMHQRLARVDALTGLGNQRAFDDALGVELARAEREHFPVTLGLVEVGGVGAVNARHGHLEGDRVLRDAAKVIETVLRGGDRCFRWGGTSFGLLLAGSDRPSAEGVVARVRERVTARCAGPDGEPIAAWSGVAELSEVSSPDDLMDLAALELVASKPGGVD